MNVSLFTAMTSDGLVSCVSRVKSTIEQSFPRGRLKVFRCSGVSLSQKTGGLVPGGVYKLLTGTGLCQQNMDFALTYFVHYALHGSRESFAI